MKSYAIELSEADVKLIKKECWAVTEAQVRNILQVWVETILSTWKVKEDKDGNQNGHQE